mmetsp:Transcript_33080/g.69625  ORF Transcript_33080/g.69625 Transcript_33080/m.69625 type:complete len:333 (+) Transcript_33080:3417-4415(+)
MLFSPLTLFFAPICLPFNLTKRNSSLFLCRSRSSAAACLRLAKKPAALCSAICSLDRKLFFLVDFFGSGLSTNSTSSSEESLELSESSSLSLLELSSMSTTTFFAALFRLVPFPKVNVCFFFLALPSSSSPMEAAAEAAAARFFLRCAACFSAATCSSYSSLLTPPGSGTSVADSLADAVMVADILAEDAPFFFDSFLEAAADDDPTSWDAFLERKMEASGPPLLTLSAPFFLVDGLADFVGLSNDDDFGGFSNNDTLVVLLFFAFFPLVLLVSLDVLLDMLLSLRGGGLDHLDKAAATEVSRKRLDLRRPDAVSSLLAADSDECFNADAPS